MTKNWRLTILFNSHNEIWLFFVIKLFKSHNLKIDWAKINPLQWQICDYIIKPL